MKTSDLFVECLKNEGVEFVFGLGGEENLDLMESLRNSDIEYIVTRHEQAAGFMAATYGRLTGKTGVCLSTLGPGATNFITSAAYAYLGGMPMLMITGQKPIKKRKQGHFQILNTVEIMKPVTKYSQQIVNGYRTPTVVREAFRIAQEERPGAVHIELPEDIAKEDVDDQPIKVSNARRAISEEKAIKEAVNMISNAKSPIILVGAGANRKRVTKMLNEFIQKTGIPFFNTQMGKGVIDERNPLYIGTAALSDNDYIHHAIKKSDLIINLGHDVVEKPPFIMGSNSQTKVIHINFYSASVDNIYFPQLEVIGDIANSIWQIKELITKNPLWDFSLFQKAKELLEKHIAEKSDDNSFPMKPQRIVADIRKVLPEDGILALDNGMYKLWFARNYKTYQPNTLLLDNALATMGAGLPSAIGAKLVYPERKVIALCGDGGFMMNSQEIETALRLKLDLVVVIVRDDGYGMIKWKQDNENYPNFGLEFQNPDFVKYAQSYGAHGHKITSAEEFEKILSDTLNDGGVHIIDVEIDYSENKKVFTDQISNINL